MDSPKYTKSEHDIKLTQMNLGTIGKIFGSGNNSSKNIVGIICIILTLTIVITVSLQGEKAKDTVSVLAPILTLGIGYLVGSKN